MSDFLKNRGAGFRLETVRLGSRRRRAEREAQEGLPRIEGVEREFEAEFFLLADNRSVGECAKGGVKGLPVQQVARDLDL